MKLAAGEYKLVIDENGDQETYDANRKIIHTKESTGFEVWREYNADGNCIHYKNSTGYEYWLEYDAKGNKSHYKNSDGREYWYYANGQKITKAEYDAIQASYDDKLVEIEDKKYKLSAI